MLKRLRIKFIAINMVLVSAVLVIMFSLVYFSTRQNLEQESVMTLQSIASEPFQLKRPGEQSDQVRLPYFVLQLTRNGTAIPVSGNYDLSDLDFVQSLLNAAEASGESIGELEEYGFRFCYSRGPWGDMVVFADMSSERSTLNGLLRTCVLAGVISFGVFLLISIRLARWAVRPVEDAWNQQRQFVSDASHELKTPLTVILTNAEMLKAADDDPPSRARAADSILTMSRQMRGLVESLLELARADNGSARAVMKDLELSGLVSEWILPWEAMFFEKDLMLETDVQESVKVHGSEDHLRQVLEILLDNALKYAETPGTVSVSLRRQGHHALLTVTTPGTPLSREDCVNIFKRFYRVDQARKMDHSYGLGLAIADQILQEHNGRIHAESGEHCNRFLVELPVLP